MSKKEIIKLIMRRDQLSYTEAEDAVNDCINEIEWACAHGHWEEAEDILLSDLGLEPDYLIGLLEI